MAMDLAELNCLQYPLTGRTSCNDRIEAANECRTDFAVPSDGSNLRQLRTRRLCVLFSRLAVPSDGSNLRQHGRSPMLAYIYQTCSTLKRVEPQATRPITRSGMASQVACSTLKRVEPQATPMRLSSFCDSAFLQYPQTGRTSGNQPNLTNNLFANWSCSTLRRVEPHATSCYSPTIRLLSVLQYPQTGRT